MNNSTYSDEDFFSFVYRDQASRILTGFCWAAITFLGTPLFTGIVSFKMFGYSSYQTLLDKLSAYYHILLLLYCLTSMHALLLRLFVKIPSPVCTGLFVHGHATIPALCLVITETQVLRFLYLCVWKNVGRLNDEFFGTFFAVFNTLVGVVQAGLMLLTKEYQTLEFALCIGSDPAIVVGAEKSGVTLTAIIVVLSCTISISLSIILYVERKYGKVGLASPGSLFDMEHSLEVLFAGGICASVAMRVYLGHVFQSGQLRFSSPTMIVMSQNSLYLTVFVLYPLLMYGRNASLRRYVRRALGELCIFQAISNVSKKIRPKVSPQH